jgi:hypothetical protein
MTNLMTYQNIDHFNDLLYSETTEHDKWQKSTHKHITMKL